MATEKGSGAFVSTINGAFASAGEGRTPAMSKSWTIIEEKVMRTKNLIHPGEILQEEFLVPLGISQTRLALDLHVPAPRINAIVRGKRAITADTALRLGQYFKMEPQFWLNLQANYDLGVASGGEWSRIKKLIPEFMPENAAAVL